jgi:hypothetical protein
MQLNMFNFIWPVGAKLFYQVLHVIQEHIPQVHVIYCILFYYQLPLYILAIVKPHTDATNANTTTLTYHAKSHEQFKVLQRYIKVYNIN